MFTASALMCSGVQPPGCLPPEALRPAGPRDRGVKYGSAWGHVGRSPAAAVCRGCVSSHLDVVEAKGRPCLEVRGEARGPRALVPEAGVHGECRWATQHRAQTCPPSPRASKLSQGSHAVAEESRRGIPDGHAVFKGNSFNNHLESVLPRLGPAGSWGTVHRHQGD